MVRLYCCCGYPLWLAARWTGEDIELVVHDGQAPPYRKQPIITSCPHCRGVLAVPELADQTVPTPLRQLDRDRAS